jgi:hypothetical protein
VQSLVAFPQVLAMMAARPDDVQRLLSVVERLAAWS